MKAVAGQPADQNVAHYLFAVASRPDMERAGFARVWDEIWRVRGMYIVMNDKSETPGHGDDPNCVPAGGSSHALSTALQKTFESLLQEPVPDKLQDLIARIREEEAREADDSGKDDNES